MTNANDLQIDYELVEEMIQAFTRTIQQLDESAAAVEDIAKILEGGGMVGKDGNRFTDTLRSKMTPGIRHSQDRLQEMIEELNLTLRLLRGEADPTARSRFMD